MKKNVFLKVITLLTLGVSLSMCKNPSTPVKEETVVTELPPVNTPEEGLVALKAGNERYL